ncbi:SphA family protein [Mannheimia massilioguelmaensis]|uniref:SphA family protein n=1 Tax=Mannheimia massilioguelmaensis TaxID=1604354 RepID=UPI00138E0FE7|nr:transporter [Mannheimia massilioguelmaensis]
MKSNALLQKLGCSLSAATLLLATISAFAQEGVSPLQPGATTGNPAGALPPEGIYFGYDVDYEWGKLHSEPVKIKASNVSMVATLVWSTPYKLLGANYAMGIAQPYKFAHTELTTPAGTSTYKANGTMSTTIMPAMLSWNLGNGLHLGAGTAFVFKNGKHATECQNGVCSNTPKNLANRYYTIQPNLALTYFKDSWAFTINNTFDFNTKNKVTDYRSGNTYYLDLTAAKNIDKWTVGVIGNWTKQLTNDKKSGVVVEGLHSTGNKIEHLMFGPMVGYNFGSFSVNARFLASVHSKNDPKMRFLHLGVSIPL